MSTGPLLRLQAALIISLFLGGCSLQNQQFARAERMERDGKVASALAGYERLLAATPAKNARRRSELLVHIGQCQYRLDRLSEALASFQRATEVDGSNTVAHLRMGELLLAAGATDQAREEAEAVLSSSASSADGLALLGAAWEAAGNMSSAMDAYLGVLQLDPTRANVAVALADLYNRQEKVEEARQVLHRAAEARPQSAMPWLALARLSEQLGDSNAAEENYRRAVAVEDTPETNLRLVQFLQRTSRIPEAEQVLRRVDAERHAFPVALADFELSSGHPDSALEQYSLALRANPVSDSMSRGNRSASEQRGAIVARAVEASLSSAQMGPASLKTSAIEKAKRQLAQNVPSLDAATADLLRAEIALSESDRGAALQYAQQALKAAADSAAAHYVMGMAHLQAKNATAARQEWAAAIDADPQFTPARLAMAEDALRCGDPQTADLQGRMAVRDEPGSIDALIVFAKSLVAQKQYGAAAVMAHRALALDPSALEPELLFGKIALQQDRIGDALLHFQKAVLLDPSSGDAINGLLQVYRKGRITRSMLRHMEQAAGQEPASATVMEITGRLYAQNGWHKDAKRCLARALQIDNRRSTAATALAQLQFAQGEISQATDSAAQAGGGSGELLMAYRAQQQNRTERAMADYERALRAGDQSEVAANNLAWLYAQQGIRLDRALVLATSASKDAPSNPAVLDTLGFVHLQRREYSEAVKVLETAALLAREGHAGTDNGELTRQIHHHLALAYLRVGQTDAAQQIAQSRARWRPFR